MAVLIVGYQVRVGRPIRARIILAISLTLFGAVGGYLIPGVGQATALLPIVSFILVLPAYITTVARGGCHGDARIDRSHPAGGQHHRSAPAARRPRAVDLPGRGILIGVVVLVLAGLADFAMESRDSLRDLHASTTRQLRVTTARLSLVAALRHVRRQPTPEATAGSIADALADLPLVDMAVVAEVTDDGLSVLAAAGDLSAPVQAAQQFPAARAEYLLDRSRSGAWAELWEDRPGAGLDDEELTRLGVEGQAFAPILADDQIVGLIGIATTDREQAEHLVADLPSVSEAGAVADSVLAPMILARRRVRSANLGSRRPSDRVRSIWSSSRSSTSTPG